MKKNKYNSKSVILRFFCGFFLALFTMIMLPGIYLALLLIFLPETFRGFLFGFSVLIVILAIMLFLTSLYLKRRKKIWIMSASGVTLGFILLSICYLLTPDRKNSQNSNVRSVFSGTVQYSRLSIANLVPEIDQLKLGTYVFPFLDPFFNYSNSSRIRNTFLKVYRELGKSEEFNHLGSVLNLCYLDIFSGTCPIGHFYEYIPESEKPLPVILFVHGSLGNFKGYLWCWKKFADQNNFAIIAPTFGSGNWNRKGGGDEILRAVKYCKSNSKLDSDNVYIVGLSNGGKGVSRVIASAPSSNFKGIIFISAVMEREIILSNAFIDKCKNNNILVLHGNKDLRIPIEYIIPQVKKMNQRGANTTAKYFPNEDHFLMFSSWDEMSYDIEAWIKKTR